MILDIKVSPKLIAALSVLHIGAALSVLLTPLPWLVRMVLWLGIAWSGYRSIARHGLRGTPTAITAIRLDDGGVYEVQFATADTWRPCQLLDPWVHPWIVIARLRCEGRRRAVGLVIPADAVVAEPFRQLRVRLRLSRVTG